jgi:antitoxin component of MazEF toxin-antitoxin module
MSRERITAVGESAALLLPKEMLDKLGIAIGDEVELSLIDRTLMLQPLDEADRAQQLVAITQTVFARRRKTGRITNRPPSLPVHRVCLSSDPSPCLPGWQ